MKKGLIVVLLIILMSVNAFSEHCDESEEKTLAKVIDEYYTAVKDEDFNSYMNVMDKDYVANHLTTDLKAYEAYVKAVFNVYDLKDYKIKIGECQTYNNTGIIFFNLKSKLVSENKNINTEQEFVALLNKKDKWQIQFIMREDLFLMHQDLAYFSNTLTQQKKCFTKKQTNHKNFKNI